MTSVTKSYFLAPNFDFPPPPLGLLTLGSVITNPHTPERSLNKGEILPIPTKAIYTSTKSDWAATRSQLRSVQGGIWTSFLQMVIGLSADIDVSRLKDKDETYRCKTLETQYFQPDEAYIAASLQHARVTDYVQKGWPLKKAVYMVTGLKIAKGVSAETGSRKEHSIEGQLGVDATAITGGVPVSAGPKGKWSSETSEGVEFGAGDDFVFAFRLIKIRQKEKAEKGFVEGDYVKGALFSAEEPIEEQVVDNAESFHDTWEVEPSEQMMQDLPDMIVKNTVDEEGDSCNVVFIMGGH